MAGEAIRTTSYGSTYRRDAAYPGFEPAYEPAPERAPKKVQEVFTHPPRIILTAREKASLLLLVVLSGIVFFGFIFVSAYCAQLQTEINQTNAASAVVQEEIDKLYIEIEKGRNIQAIEKAAKKQLKMSYPSGDMIKYIGEMKYNKEDLAQYLREKAYG